jgi:glutamine cyclotransferase
MQRTFAILGAAAIVIMALMFAAGSRGGGSVAPAAAPVYRAAVVASYPHDPGAFTQGLIVRGEFFYESTGVTGRSSLRQVDITTGEIVRQRALDNRLFGEGLTERGGQLVQLTPARTRQDLADAYDESGSMGPVLTLLARRFGTNVGATYDLETFAPGPTFGYEREGWGLSYDGRRFILSDGSARLRFLHGESFARLGGVTVTDAGKPVERLNELEYVRGSVYANVWFTDRIAVIDPVSGRVRGWIDVSEAVAQLPDLKDQAAVLNGIAYDAAADRLFVTGKRWPRVFEIRVQR